MELIHSLLTDLNCSICLETFSNPLTLPCGHTFCQACIHKTWDSLNPQTVSVCCPGCRFDFPQRPEPQKNVTLHKVLEDVKELHYKFQAALPLPESGPEGARSVCQEHNRRLTVYCLTEKRCICHKCLLATCLTHHMEDIEEHCAKEREKLAIDFAASGHQKELLEKETEDWKGKSQNIKDAHDTLVSRVTTNFELVWKSLEECQALVVERVRRDEEAALAQVSHHLQLLHQHRQDLKKYRLETKQLLDPSTGDVKFLEAFPHLAPVGPAPVSPNVELCGTVKMDAITRVLSEVTRLLQEDLPNTLHPVAVQPGPREIPAETSSMGIAGACSPPQTSISFPGAMKTELDTDLPAMSPIRAQLHKDYRDLAFDPETANRHIEISQQNCQASHKTSLRCNAVPESPKRFQTWQVMCTEGFLKGSHYWEVDVSTLFVQIGVAYGILNKEKKGKENDIGRNSHSWSLELRSTGHSVWHDNKSYSLKAPMYRRFGVHLDCEVGRITFYGVKDGDLERLHMFQCSFTERLYPVFWIGENVTVKLYHMQNNPGAHAV